MQAHTGFNFQVLTMTTSTSSTSTGIRVGTPAYRRISLALFLAGFATFSLLYCVQPLLQEFTVEFGVSAATSSLSLSLSTICLAIAIFCAGALSEGVDRRRLMFISMMLASLCNIAVAMTPGWHSLLVFRAIEGLLLGGVPAVAMAYLAEEIHHEGLGLSMGLYVGGTAFGGMIGRIFMSVVTDHFSWRAAMAAMGVLDLLAAIGFVMLLPASSRIVQRSVLSVNRHVTIWRGLMTQRALPLLFLTGFIVMGIFVSLYNYIGFRLTAAPYNLTQTQIGLIFFAYLLGIVVSPVAGWLSDKLGRGPVLVCGLVLMTTGMLLTLLQSLVFICIGIAVTTTGFFMSHAIASTWVGWYAKQHKGHASSLYLLAYYIGSSLLGAFGGWFWEHDGWFAVVMFSLVLLGTAGILAWQLQRQPTTTVPTPVLPDTQ